MRRGAAAGSRRSAGPAHGLIPVRPPAGGGRGQSPAGGMGGGGVAGGGSLAGGAHDHPRRRGGAHAPAQDRLAVPHTHTHSTTRTRRPEVIEIKGHKKRLRNGAEDRSAPAGDGILAAGRRAPTEAPRLCERRSRCRFPGRRLRSYDSLTCDGSDERARRAGREGSEDSIGRRRRRCCDPRHKECGALWDC